MEVESLVEQARTSGPGLAQIQGEAVQDAIVFSQPVVDIPHQVAIVPIKTVVVGIAAIVGTKFLVRPAPDGITAFQTHPFHSNL